MDQSSSRPLEREEIEAFGAELDALRQRVLGSLGEEDARYIRRIRSTVRWTGLGGRALLFASVLPPAWVGGTLLLGLSKILENMELGHNVMHGQYDWMRDPEFRSQSYEWDTVCPADAWRHSHNYLHHTFTNVVGRDRDVGYGVLRIFPEQPWHPGFLPQPLYAVWLALWFEWGVAFHDLELDRVIRGEKSPKQAARELFPVLRKASRQVAKDYIVFPAMAGPLFIPVLAGNATANVLRNVWAFLVIFCGHFTDGVESFQESNLADETRGEWYLRQLRGSSNLEGGPVFHVLTGNLSHQIEHHLFPDVPAHRYGQMAEDVRRIARKYGQHYETGSLVRQFATVARRILRQSFPSRPAKPRPAIGDVPTLQGVAA
ncbi:MAG TPA: fatty acid desaturase [Polyangiaceae bacterium]|nr:fatty acid desaturase [Polyangiaceae bacterium]